MINCNECKYGHRMKKGKPCPPGNYLITEGSKMSKVLDYIGGRYYHYEDLITGKNGRLTKNRKRKKNQGNY